MSQQMAALAITVRGTMSATVWLWTIVLATSHAADRGDEGRHGEERTREICNCEDDDGDGLIDENLICEYPLELELTADDAYEAFIDGNFVGSDTDWTDIETYTQLVAPGLHHLSVYAKDTQNVVAGFLAAVRVNGQLEDVTGINSAWRGTSGTPPATWLTSTAGLNLPVAATCTQWGTYWPAPLLGQGAEWIWEKDCADPVNYPANYYTIAVEVCPEAYEKCNGFDDDGDGDIDEGYPDTDGDGIADCVDREECDCLDNDGDGDVDEGLRCEYPVAMRITADDAYEAYFDGSLWGSDNDWFSIESYSTAAVAGTHHIGVYAYDTSGVAAGFISAVAVNGQVVELTDMSGSLWLGSDTYPGPGWATSTVGLASTVSASCSVWGAYWPGPLLGMGADWVWDADCSDPTTYDENWYVLEFEVCPQAL